MVPVLPDYPFCRCFHDRLAELRDNEEFLAKSWSDPQTRVLVVGDGELAVRSDSDQLRLLSPAESPPGERVLLGRAKGAVCFAVLPPEERRGLSVQPSESKPAYPNRVAPDATSGDRFLSLRRLAPLLDEESASLAVHAAALAGWHRRHQRCAQCGAVTVSASAGAYRRCPACGAEHYPRTDPAVIMLVTDADDRCLLGHNGARPAGWFSTLAGFVEPGETPEQAVVREVREEVGVEIATTEYAGSQPWPFPSSLMLGYFATARTTDLVVDGHEITDAAWFSRDQLTAAVQSGTLGLPTTVSIAGALITAWYGEPLPANDLPG